MSLKPTLTSKTYSKKVLKAITHPHQHAHTLIESVIGFNLDRMLYDHQD